MCVVFMSKRQVVSLKEGARKKIFVFCVVVMGTPMENANNAKSWFYSTFLVFVGLIRINKSDKTAIENFDYKSLYFHFSVYRFCVY